MDRRKILLVVAVVVAALGAGLVFVYAQDAEDRASEQVATVDVLVVTAPISPGELASDAAASGKILSQPVPADQVLEGSTDDGTVFAGQIALTKLYPGEQLLTQKFGTVEDIESEVSLPIPDGMVAKPVALDDVARVGGFTTPGSRVGVFVTGTFAPSTEPETRLLLDEVTILATGSTTISAPATNPDGTVAPVTDAVPISQYTLALKPRDAARVTLAQTLGSLSLVLLPPDAKLEIGDSITADSVFSE